MVKHWQYSCQPCFSLAFLLLLMHADPEIFLCLSCDNRDSAYNTIHSHRPCCRRRPTNRSDIQIHTTHRAFPSASCHQHFHLLIFILIFVYLLCSLFCLSFAHAHALYRYLSIPFMFAINISIFTACTHYVFTYSVHCF